ncbi:MAG: hypothetical protein IT466_11095 [Moraxellaceae bacterium]|nr:hypothetical protein [Moraxellaceae bacterium]
MKDGYLDDHHAIFGRQYTGNVYGPLSATGEMRSRRTLRRWAKKVGLPDLATVTAATPATQRTSTGEDEQ